MRSNYDVLVYAADAEDFETEGLCGPLAPISCVSVEEAGGDSSLEMAHEYDEQGRWKHLAVGNILRAWVQMRTPPTIDANGGHITSVEVWTVKATATKAQRYLYSKRTGGKKLKLLPAGATVEVTQKTSGRYRVTTQWGQGYVNPDALSYEIDYTIPDDGDDAVIAPVQIRPQLFEIYSIERGLESLTVYARHISYQLMKNLTTYSADAPVSLGACAQGILDGCMQAHAFQAHSDMLDTRTGVAWKRVNPLEAILDPETGVMALWRCELLRDNWDIYLLESVGADRGVTIEAGKNLAGITVTEDVTNVATQLIPVAQDKDGSELLLPEGSIVSERADDYPQRYIYTFQCPDKVDSSHSKASVLASMRAQCQQMLDGGCDLPTLSVSVEVAQIEEAEAAGAPVDAERRVVELLEPLPVYDWVSVYDGRRGMAFRAQIVRREWDCIHGRLNAIEAGTLAATMGSVSIATWQVPDGVSGMKLAAGTVGAAALRADSVTAAAINAESLTADSAVVVKLSAAALDAVTAHITALTAGTVRTDTLVAGVAHMLELAAGDITAAGLQVDELAAQLANVAVLCAGTASFDRATVTHLVANALNLSYGVGDEVFISNLKVDYAQMAEAAIGNLCVKASNGNYYTIDVAADGTVTATQATVTQAEINAGQTTSGRVILDTEITASSLTTSTLLGTYALINAIDAARIDVDQLFAREAFVDKLNTGTVLTPGLLTIRSEASAAQASADAAQAAADAIQVGGRNLLKASGTQQGGTAYYCARYYYGDQLPEVGGAYMLTFKAKLGEGKTGFCAYNSGGNVYEVYGTSNPLQPESVDADGWGYYRLEIPQWRAQDGVEQTHLRLYVCPNSVTGVNSYVAWAKLESGNRATDWTPAPEDVDSGISAAQASADAAQADIDGLQVGGRNLVKGTADAHSSPQSSNNSAYPVIYALSDYGAEQVAASADGRKFTVSFDWTVSALPQKNEARMYGVLCGSAMVSADDTPIQHYFTDGATSGHYERTIVVSDLHRTNLATKKHANARLYSVEDGIVLTISNYKLEAGTRATDWTLAPEDTDAAIATAQSAADAAQESVDSMVIGGRNMLLGTGEDVTITVTDPAVNTYTDYYAQSDWGKAHTAGNQTDWMTISYDWESTSETGYAWPQIEGTTMGIVKSATGYAEGYNYRIALGEGSGRYTCTFKLTADQAQQAQQRIRFRITNTTGARATQGSTLTIRNLKFEMGERATDWTLAPEDVQSDIAAAASAAAAAAADIVDISSSIIAMQAQIDGTIESWYYSGAPTLNNAPASGWTSETLKQRHEGDTYTDLDTGYSYRWVKTNGVWGWLEISDTATAQALAAAAEARDIADHKRRVFVATPEPPYDAGDLWVQGSGGDILRCQTPKADGETYAAADWVLASKYTDDTTATAAASAASAAQSTATAAGTAAAAAQADATAAGTAAAAAQADATAAGTAAAAAQASADAAQADIDGLQIGGRNLLLGTAAERTSAASASNSAYTDFWYFSDDGAQKIRDGNACVVSFDWELSEQAVSGGTAPFIYAQLNKSIIAMSGVVTTQPLGSDLSGHYEMPFVPNATQKAYANSFCLRIRVQYAQDGLTFTVRNLKVEAGNRATDWTPAPEDVDSAIRQVASSVECVVGTQTAATNAWTGAAAFSALKDGQTILYWLPYAGTSTAATLNLTLSGGGTTGAKNVYIDGTTRCTTHIAAGNMVQMVYRVGAIIGGTSYTGWWISRARNDNYYDRVRFQSAVMAKVAISASCVIVSDASGFFPLAAGSVFDVDKPILYAGSAINAGATGNNNYINYSTCTLRNNAGSTWTTTQYATLYLAGTLSGRTFTAAASGWLTTAPADDALTYISLGYMYSTYQMNLYPEHPMYRLIDGRLTAVSQLAYEAQVTADGAQLAAEAAQATADDAAGVTRQLKHWFEFSETDGLVTQAEGSTYSTVVDAEGFHVRQNGEKIGSFAKRRLAAEEIRVGKVTTAATRCVLREAGDGGMIITVEGLT